MTVDELADIETSLASAMSSSGYAQTSEWAVKNGRKLITEINRLRQIIRVNGLRAGASHADVDDVLSGQ